MKKCFSGLFVLISFCCFAKGQSILIKPDDRHLQFEGRIMLKKDSAALSWTGTSVKIAFTGTQLKVRLRDEEGKNFLKVIVDGRPVNDIHTDALKHDYLLTSGLRSGYHTVQLFKRTEWTFGKTWFYGFEIEDGLIAKLPLPYKRKITFYGNSITCGYAVLDTTGKDRGTPEFEDGYQSYSALTARHFNAGYSCIARSGIGIMVSWFPQIMPELYYRLDPADSASRWNFKNDKPNVIVINLFQNDSWIVKQPDNLQFKVRFGNTAPNAQQIISAYKNFIELLRTQYPKTPIICLLGNMDITKEGSPWPGYITKAVEEIQDKYITCHFIPYKNTPGHPKIAEQQAAANDLIAYINKTIKW